MTAVGTEYTHPRWCDPRLCQVEQHEAGPWVVHSAEPTETMCGPDTDTLLSVVLTRTDLLMRDGRQITAPPLVLLELRKPDSDAECAVELDPADLTTLVRALLHCEDLIDPVGGCGVSYEYRPRTTPQPLSERDAATVKHHLDWMRRRGLSPRNIRDREGVLRRLAASLPGDLVEADAIELDRWQSALTVGLSALGTYTGHVKALYRWLVESDQIEHDPAKRLPMPRIPQRLPRPIPEAHLELAFTAAHEPLLTWLILAAFMGLRAGDVAAMRRESVEIIDERLWITGVGKGSKAFRLVVPVEVEPFIRRHLTARPGSLWRTATGRPIRADDVTNQTTALMRSLGFTYVLHQLRHRFGTVLYAESRDLLLTANAMRHSNLSTTRGYVATSRDEVVEAMDQVSRSLHRRTKLAPVQQLRRGKDGAA